MPLDVEAVSVSGVIVMAEDAAWGSIATATVGAILLLFGYRQFRQRKA